MPRRKSSREEGSRTTGARAPSNNPSKPDSRSTDSLSPPRNPPVPVYPSPPPTNKNLTSRTSDAVIDGLTAGITRAVGALVERAVVAAVNSLVGRRKSTTVSAPAEKPAAKTGSQGDACGGQAKAFRDCLSENSDISNCQFYTDSLRECKGIKKPKGVLESLFDYQ